jgi:hypothetical protein
MADLSNQRKKLRDAMLQRFCEMAVGYGLSRPDALILAQDEANKLLSLQVLTESHLGQAEAHIFYVCHNMGLPMSSVPAASRQVLPKIARSDPQFDRSEKSHRPPRLQHWELADLDARNIVDLIQALADPKFLRKHSMEGDPAKIARYMNKVCTTLYKFRFAFFDTKAPHLLMH